MRERGRLYPEPITGAARTVTFCPQTATKYGERPAGFVVTAGAA